MAVCPSCGAYLVPPYRFCPSCGRPVPEMLPYPPPATYIPPKKDNTLTIVVVLVIVVLVLSVALPAILYVMVSGLIGSGPRTGGPLSKPTVTLTVNKITGGVSILVAGIQPATPPPDLKVNIQNFTSSEAGSAMPMPTASGTSVRVSVSGVSFTIEWNNPGGSGVLSQGDTFVVTYAAAVGTRWAFLLIWTDGSVLATNTNWLA